jgi:hypothetical protein
VSAWQGWADDPSLRLPSGHDIHAWFGLSYASYLVIPRTLLQSMPGEWQLAFVALLEDLDEAFTHVEQAEAWKVDAATVHEVGELDENQLAALSITREEPDCQDMDDDGGCCCEKIFRDAGGRELGHGETVLIPCADPVPHYDRGRARVLTRFEDSGARAGVPAGE